MSDPENVPEYLKRLPPDTPRVGAGNFDHTDVVWGGKDGSLDPDDIIAGHGREYDAPLLQVLRALVAAHHTDLDERGVAVLTREICRKITGTSASKGRPIDDDSAMLMEIAYRYHEALYAEGQWPNGTVPLKPIVREVHKDFGAEHLDGRILDAESHIKILTRKFTKDRDIWLSRVTTDDRNYDPTRLQNIEKLKTGLCLLSEAGVRVDIEQVEPTTRP